MSKWTPEEVLRHPQRVADEISKLETDRAELVEKANLLLTALSASRANPVFSNIVDQRADDLAALLARPEADK